LRRENGTVALFTPGGAILLDGRPAEFGFAPVGVITPDMAVGGALSGLTINGQAVDTGAESGKIAGGRLAALFDIRDVQAPFAQTQVDSIARDLIERFENPAVDPTLLVGDPGLFTDAGSALVPADELGLANRIAVNALVDPAQGGNLWRLRDGLGAIAPGNVGDATLINALSDALGTARIPASGGFVAAMSASALASAVSTDFATSQASFDQRRAFAASQLDTLVTEEASKGVDTDQEMQTLLLVEQAYAANARVISTIDELLETLLRI
jgi:flagellar hook-associated protein 1 FlgK